MSKIKETNLLKKPNAKKSIISKLKKEQRFYITLIAKLNSELITEQIITPMQKSQIEKYILSKI